MKDPRKHASTEAALHRPCALCGDALVDDRCLACSARSAGRARWTAYAIIGVLAVVTPLLSFKLV